MLLKKALPLGNILVFWKCSNRFFHFKHSMFSNFKLLLESTRVLGVLGFDLNRMGVQEDWDSVCKIKC